MAERPISLLDTVALLRDAPESGLVKGQVGAVVEILVGATVLVEFVDASGATFALAPFDRKDLLRLAYDLQAAE